MEGIILWIIVSVVGQVLSILLALRARRNRKRVANQYKLMAWSIEADALITVITVAFFLAAGLALTPYTLFGSLVMYEEFIRTWIARPLIVGGLVSIVVRLLVLYGFLKVIEEKEIDGN